MHNAPAPPPDQLPNPRALFRSTLIAVATAAVLLVTVVMPAEYGVDPTGVGDVLGLTRMGQIKVALAREAEADAAAAAAADSAEAAASRAFAERSASPAGAVPQASETPGSSAAPEGAANLKTVEVLIEPGQARDFRLVMKAGARAGYEWWTDWGVVDFEMDGRPASSTGSARSYSEGSGRAADEGSLTAAFEGLHGWTWRNRGTEPVTVTLRVQGDYLELREIK